MTLIPTGVLSIEDVAGVLNSAQMFKTYKKGINNAIKKETVPLFPECSPANLLHPERNPR